MGMGRGFGVTITLPPHIVQMRDVLYIYTKDPHWEEKGFFKCATNSAFSRSTAKKNRNIKYYVK